MRKYFPSAQSTGLGLIIWTVLLIPYGLSIYQIFQGQVTTELLVRMGILSFVILIVGAIWFRTGYYIANAHLYVKIGPFAHSNFDISTITEISATNSWISAPANSFNRLAIKSGDRLLVIVSPKDQEAFIELLKTINPRINFDL